MYVSSSYIRCSWQEGEGTNGYSDPVSDYTFGKTEGMTELIKANLENTLESRLESSLPYSRSVKVRPPNEVRITEDKFYRFSLLF